MDPQINEHLLKLRENVKVALDIYRDALRDSEVHVVNLFDRENVTASKAQVEAAQRVLFMD